MKNRLRLFLVLTAVSVFLSACLKDELDTPCRNDEGRLQLTLSIGDPEEVAITRSEASSLERQITDLYLLVFDASTGLYKVGEKGGTFPNNGTATATLKSNLIVKTGDKVVVLANTGQTVTTIPLTEGVSTVADINAAFPSGDVLGTTPATIWKFMPRGNGANIPMSGEFVVTSPTQTQTCNLRRSVAKINVVLDPNIQDATGVFTPGNVKFLVVNSANYGHVYAPEGAMSIPDAGMTFGMYNTYTEVPYYSGSTQLSSSRYIPEYNSSVRAKEVAVVNTEFHRDRMCLIVRGFGQRFMFYRLDIATGNTSAETKEFLDIVRNKHYMVKITKVKSMGYATQAEALSAPGSNLEYEVNVSEDNGNMILSNGQYAVSLSNDETVILANAEVYEVATAHYIIPDELESTIQPADLTNTVTMNSSSPYAKLLTTSLTSVDAPILVRFGDNASSTNLITIQFGNITRTLTVHRQMAFDAHYGAASFAVSSDTQALTWKPTFAGLTSTRNPDGTLSINATVENIRPVQWMEASTASGSDYVSTEGDLAAFPVFEDQYAEGFAMRAGSLPGRLKAIVFRSAPIYGGWWGGEPAEAATGSAMSTYFGKRLIVEGIEETDSHQFAPEGSNPYGVFDPDRGRANTMKLMTATPKSDYAAAYCCYLKNDRNGNGVIDADEPVLWYLPAKSQLLGIYVYTGSWHKSFSPRDRHWSSTETPRSSSEDLSYYFPWCFGFNKGDMRLGLTPMRSREKVRCVRDM